MAALGLDARVEKVTDPAEIASFGTMKTPGLEVADQVEVWGRLPKTEEIGQLLSRRRVSPKQGAKVS